MCTRSCARRMATTTGSMCYGSTMRMRTKCRRRRVGKGAGTALPRGTISRTPCPRGPASPRGHGARESGRRWTAVPAPLPTLRSLMRMRIMLPQHIDPIVVAVGRAHDRVHVELGRLGIGEEHAGMMIELDESDRALDPIIEWADLVESADPAEMRLGEMALDLAHAHRIGPARQGRDIGGDEVEQIALLQPAQLTHAQSLER